MRRRISCLLAMIVPCVSACSQPGPPPAQTASAAESQPTLVSDEPWWSNLRASPTETLVTASADQRDAYWIDSAIKRSPSGNPIVAVHAETQSITPQKPGLSQRSVQEFNCLDGRYRFLDVAIFSDRKLSGQVVLEVRAPAATWQLAAPYTVADTELRYVCKIPARGRNRTPPASNTSFL